MKVFIRKAVTLTVKAGQEIEVFDADAPNLIRLGFATKVADPAPAVKKQAKKTARKTKKESE